MAGVFKGKGQRREKIMERGLGFVSFVPILRDPKSLTASFFSPPKIAITNCISVISELMGQIVRGACRSVF